MSSGFTVAAFKSHPSFYWWRKFHCLLCKFPNGFLMWWTCKVSPPLGFMTNIEMNVEMKTLWNLDFKPLCKYPNGSLLFWVIVYLFLRNIIYQIFANTFLLFIKNRKNKNKPKKLVFGKMGIPTNVKRYYDLHWKFVDE